MLYNYLGRGLEVLREEGIRKLLFKVNRFFQSGPPRIHFHTVKNDWLNRIIYDAPPQPYDTINVDVDEINYKIKATGNLKSLPEGGIGQIQDGKWDLPSNRTLVDDNTVIKGFKQRFEQGMKWKSTTYYKTWVNKYSKINNFNKKGFNNPEKYVMDKCRFYDNLFEEIKQNGYLSNHIGTECHISDGYMDQLEVMVTIGRDGEIYFYEGHHRFAIARILELEIPVQVVCRHKHWQNKRDNIYHNSFIGSRNANIQNHPDLNDVFDNAGE